MDELMGFFLKHPQGLISMGRGVVGCCAMAICAGMAGLVVRTGAAFARGFGTAVACLVTAAIGVYLVLLGRKIVRIYY